MKKLCVIFGGASSEHDISIITGMQLAKNLSKSVKIEKIYLSLTNQFYLASKIEDLKFFTNKQKITLPEIIISNNAVYKKGVILKKFFDIDCVINCCHGGVGENGDLAGFFEVNNVKVTSSDTLSSHIAMDKSLAKLMLKDVVPTIDGVCINENNKSEMVERILKDFPDNLIVKPNSLGSSIGVKACDKSNFQQQIDAIFLMKDNALVEHQIMDIIEYNQACIMTEKGLVLSAIEQPKTKNMFLTFEDKYQSTGKGKDRIIPAKLSSKLNAQISNFTKQIYTTLNLSGVVRVDYIYDNSTKQLYFNEVNTIPGSMAFYLFEPVGIDYITLVNLLVSNAKNAHQYKYFETDVLKGKKL